jgi:hypothetical protein
MLYECDILLQGAGFKEKDKGDRAVTNSIKEGAFLKNTSINYLEQEFTPKM